MNERDVVGTGGSTGTLVVVISLVVGVFDGKSSRRLDMLEITGGRIGGIICGEVLDVATWVLECEDDEGAGGIMGGIKGCVDVTAGEDDVEAPGRIGGISW